MALRCPTTERAPWSAIRWHPLFQPGRLSLKNRTGRCYLPSLVRFSNRPERVYRCRLKEGERLPSVTVKGEQGAPHRAMFPVKETAFVEPVVPRQEGANPCRRRGLRLRDGGTTGCGAPLEGSECWAVHRGLRGSGSDET